MESIFIKSIVLCIMLMSIAQADDKLYETDTLFPQNIVFNYNNEPLNLTLTGLTIRKKFFLKIYSMAHYIEQKPAVSASDISTNNIYQSILQNNGAKQIKMVFLRPLTAEQIQKSLRSGLKLNTNEEEYLRILPQVEEFMGAINDDVERNNEFVIRWLPDGTLISLFQGKKISVIKNNLFAKTLWSIWFGEYSVVKRKSLIEQLLASY